jgi:hypothetical protein
MAHPRTSTVEVLVGSTTLVAKGKQRIFLILGHVNGTFVPYRILDGEHRENAVRALFGDAILSDWPEERCCSFADIPPSARSDRNSARRSE